MNLGNSVEELCGLSIFDIDPLVNSDNFGEIWQSLLDGGVDAFETIHLRKDGTGMPVEIASNLLEYEGRQYSLCFVLDITERRQQEAEVQRLRNYLANIIDSMPSVLVGVDTNGKVTHWNKTAERSSGITQDEALGKKLPEVFPQMASEMESVFKCVQTQQSRQDVKITSSHWYRCPVRVPKFSRSCSTSFKMEPRPCRGPGPKIRIF